MFSAKTSDFKYSFEYSYFSHFICHKLYIFAQNAKKEQKTTRIYVKDFGLLLPKHEKMDENALLPSFKLHCSIC